MLPEGLNKEDMEKFKVLAKFAFDSYHPGAPQHLLYRFEPKESARKVIFFKVDIPEGLIHFGFMNESTEMYAGKGVEQTFSFLHLSLQEYLAAWHLAHSYSIEFQVAYYKLAVNPYQSTSKLCKGSDKEEEALISSLAPLGTSLEEPAVFLAGITGLNCQSKDGKNLWQMYLSHDTPNIEDRKMLLFSLYEAQNEDIIPHYFNFGTKRREIAIPSRLIFTPYDFYTFAYCFAHSSDQFRFIITVEDDDDVSFVETLALFSISCQTTNTQYSYWTPYTLVVGFP